MHCSDGQNVAVDLDAELFQQSYRDCPSSDPCSRLPCTGPFQHVADIIEAVLHGARQVGMARTETGDALGAGALGRAFQRVDGHGLFPVGPVLVLHGHADGAAKGEAVAHTGDDLGPVLLDEHAATAAVPLLAAGQVDTDIVFADGQSGRDAL